MKVMKKKTLLYCMLVVVCIFLLSAGAGRFVQRQYSSLRKREVGRLLKMYKDNMTLVIRDQLNYADEIVNAEPDILHHEAWFKQRAQNLIDQKGVEKILLFKGDKVQYAISADGSRNDLGRDLRDYSYIYTISKVVKEPVVEGPVRLDKKGKKKEVFLFFEPLLEGKDYKGEVAVALDKY